jgi:hypothetical protein
VLQELDLLGRLEQARRKSRCVQQPPEVVARIGEVCARSRRYPAGVDPAEDDAQIRG